MARISGLALFTLLLSCSAAFGSIITVANRTIADNDGDYGLNSFKRELYPGADRHCDKNEGYCWKRHGFLGLRWCWTRPYGADPCQRERCATISGCTDAWPCWSGESDECKNRPPPTPVKRPDGPHEKPRPYRNLYFLRSHVKKFEAKHHIPENVSKQLDQAVDDLESKKITPLQFLLKAREILHDYLKNKKAGKHSSQRDVEVDSGLSEEDEFEAMLEEWSKSL
ncbi:hypothetical protein BDQ12DRAFT_728495 [Crucibulum laeve]|uniref:Uncharacterized protein n=1 Tax=Crucibulum laeve TaxID=68775 RepID=A0A5C3LL65_9AGAR|nr:hypothetical protein BDQ12DRAFT_728495 [Crucibulum laeve]